MRNIQTRIFSRAAWLSMMIGSVLTGTASAQAGDAALPVAEPRNNVADVAATSATTVQAPVVATGPVYAYGPVIQRAQPRQRQQAPNVGGRNFSRYNFSRYGGMRTAGPYRTYQTPGYPPNWQFARPRSNQNMPQNATGNTWRGNVAPNYNPYGSYRGQWASRQNPNSLAWYDRGGRQTDAPNWVRQPNWRY
jgi:hypothetical protein